jgi:hypothetical protein
MEPWTLKNVDSEVSKCSSDSSKKNALQDQIKIFWRGWGCGWAQTAFSKKGDPMISTVEYLTMRLKFILKEVKHLKISKPDDLPLSPSPLKSIPELGTLTVDAVKLKNKARFTFESSSVLTNLNLLEAKHSKRKRADKEVDEHAHTQPNVI